MGEKQMKCQRKMKVAGIVLFKKSRDESKSEIPSVTNRHNARYFLKMEKFGGSTKV